MSFHDTIRRFPSRLAATLAAALVAVTVLAFPVDAQPYTCQKQWDQKCINTGWHFGSNITCTDHNSADGFDPIRNYCWKNSVGASNRIHGATLNSFTGTGWYKPSGYNSWNFYPAYFKNGRIYVRARCRTGNMGTTMTWAKHPHSMTETDNVVVDINDNTVPCS